MSDGNTVLLFQLVLDALNRCAIRRVQLPHPAPSAKHVAISTHLMASPVPLHVISHTSLMRTEHAVRAGVCSNTPPHTMALSSSSTPALCTLNCQNGGTLRSDMCACNCTAVSTGSVCSSKGCFTW